MHVHTLALGSEFRLFVEQPDGFMNVQTFRGQTFLREQRNVTKRAARSLWRSLTRDGFELHSSTKVRTPKGWVPKPTYRPDYQEPEALGLPGIE